MASNDMRARARSIERIALRVFLYLLLATSVGTGINAATRPSMFPDARATAAFAWLTAAVATAGLAATARD